MAFQELLSKIVGVVQTKQATADTAYRDLVRQAAAGRPVDPEAAAAALERAGRTPEGFEADVRLASDRIAWKKQVEARPALLARKERLEQTIAALNAEIEEHEKKLRVRIDKLHAEYKAASAEVAACGDAETKLARTNPDPELAAAVAAAGKAVLAANEEAERVARWEQDCAFWAAKDPDKDGANRAQIESSRHRLPELQRRRAEAEAALQAARDEQARLDRRARDA